MRVVFLSIAFAAVVLLGSLSVVHAQFLTDEDRARLQQEYDSIQAEIAEWQKVIADTKAKKDSLQGDVTALNALIKKASAEIQARNNTIKRLSDDIAHKEEGITELTERLQRGKESFASMLRIQREADEQSIAELVLSSQDFSTFFGDLDALATVRRELEGLFKQIQELKTKTESEKATLAAKQEQEVDARYEVELTKKQIAKNEAEKSKLLKVTADSEKAYQGVLADRVREAERIQNALFPLRDVEGISFGVALDHAAYASQKTGVRPALILAILSQESDLGKNVGSCYVTSLDTGDGVGKNTGAVFQKVMKSPRDTVPFERITEGVGRIWGATAVSCPLGKVYTSSRGYGGAMGPSQFIPSTWELYVNRLKTTLGISNPDPWNPKDAIMATALYLEDLGADAGTYSAERNAACRYYSGRSCDTKKPTNYTYGNSVITKAEEFQTNIDFLKGV